MARKSEWEQVVEATIHRHLENFLSASLDEPVKLSRRQVSAYCKAIGEIERENEIQSAIDMLEREGYSVRKRRKR